MVADLLPENWEKEVLSFWFDELTTKDWFSSTPELDQRIQAKFSGFLSALRADVPEAAYKDATMALAAILVLDQLSRNIFRAKAEAFAGDAQAVKLTLNGIERGLDQEIPVNRRNFFYMPLMHSENLDHQKTSLDLFRQYFPESVKWAVDHHDVIERFGRFPHRNAVLGRATTPEEEEFLKTANRYGQ